MSYPFRHRFLSFSDAGVSDDRDTAATHVVSGAVVSAAADVVRRSVEGIFSERSGENLALQSESLSTWGAISGGGTVTDNAADAPTNPAATTADRFAAATTDTPGRYRSVATANGVQYIFSAHVSPGTRGIVTLYFDGGGMDAGRAFNLDAGTSTQIGGAADSYGLETLANGWQRVWIIDTATGSCSIQVYSGTAGGGSTVGLYIDVWGMMLEVSGGRTSPSSYIPTEAIAVARNADNITKSLSAYSFSSGLSLVSRFTVPTYDGENHVVLQLDDNAAVSENLCLAPEDLSSASWTTKTAVTISANVFPAPNGTLTADKLVETAANSAHEIAQTVAGATIGARYSFSAFFHAAEKTTGLVVLAAPAGQYIATGVSLVDGTILDTGSGGGMTRITGGAEEVLPGWWWVWVTGSSPDQSSLIPVLAITGGVYVGTAGSGIYVWGAKLSAGNVSAYTAGEVERLRHILLPSPNLLSSPEALDNVAWIVVAGTMANNAAVAPDGTTSASSFTATVGTADFAFYQAKTVPSGSTVALSFYLKVDDANFFGVRITSGSDAHGFYAAFNIASGVAGSSGANGAGVLTESGIEVDDDGWVRISLVGNIPGNTTYYVIGKILDSATWTGTNAGTAQNGETLYLWGPQLEYNSLITTYTPLEEFQAHSYVNATGSSWSSVNKAAAFTLTENGNLATSTLGDRGSVLGNDGFDIAVDAVYFEIEVVAWTLAGTGTLQIGIAPTGYDVDAINTPGTTKAYESDGDKTAPAAAYGNTYTQGDIIGVAASGGKVWFAKNGTWQASGDPEAGTNEAFSGLSGEYFPLARDLTAAASMSYRLITQTADFNYAAPSGFSPLASFIDMDLGAATPGTEVSIASAHSSSGHQASLNGATKVTANGAMPSGIVTARFGHDNTPANHLDDYLSDVLIYNDGGLDVEGAASGSTVDPDWLFLLDFSADEYYLNAEPTYRLRGGWQTATWAELLTTYGMWAKLTAFTWDELAAGPVPAEEVLRLSARRDLGSIDKSPSVGAAELIFDNDIGALQFPSGARRIRPGHRVTAKVESPVGSIYGIFSGWVDEVSASPAVGRREVSVRASDISKLLRSAFSAPLQVEIVAASVASIVTSMAGIAESALDLDPSISDVIPFVTFDAKQPTSFFQELMEGTASFFYVSGAGKITTKSRESETFATDIASLDGFYSMSGRSSINTVANDVFISGGSRKAPTDPTTVANVSAPISIPSSSSVAFFLEFVDPETRETLPVNSGNSIVSSGQFSVNDIEDGSGTDLSAQTSVSATFFANTALVTVANNSSSPGYLRELFLYGFPLRNTPQFSAREVDTDSEASYERRRRDVASDILPGLFMAQDYAKWMIYRYSEPKPAIEMALKNEFPISYMSDLFSALHISENFLSVASSFIVEGIRHSIVFDSGAGTSHEVIFDLGLKGSRDFFRLDTDSLDGSKVLGF